MTDYATKQDVKEIVGQAVDDVSEIINTFANRVDERFVKVEAQLDSLQHQVKLINERLDNLEISHTHLINTLDAFLKRLDDIRADNAARDAQIARLERWIEKVAQKSGVKLEY